MSAPPILALRKKIVAHLKSDATILAVLPSGQIFGERASSDPIWPFSRIGELEGSPGHVVNGNIHVFSKGDFTDEVNGIIERIGTSIDSAVLELPDGRTAHLALVRTRILPDPEEQSAWHGIVEFEARIARDCNDA